jgi:glyoxalase family protein
MLMQLEGIHHITAITGDAPRNVDFYARVLGMRLVKKTVNQDDPSVYHLFYADELGSAGADLTFFEYPGAIPGRPGAGMVHRIVTRVASPAALDFWEERLAGEGVATERAGDSLGFADPEGMAHQLVVVDRPDAPLVARHREIPPELALQGFEAVRASSMRPDSTQRVLEEGLNFTSAGDSVWEARGESRGGLYALDPLPDGRRGVPGAGTVHHVAFASTYEDHEAWGERVRGLGLTPTPVIDRFYFRSIYFREPGGVLIEIATLGPGFTSDEPLLSLGEHLSLPPDFEHLRDRIEPVLTPLPDIRAWRPEAQ